MCLSPRETGAPHPHVPASLCVHSLLPKQQQAKGAGPSWEGAAGGRLELNSPAALECQASRSPAAARLLAPVRSQEQPGARSSGSGNASRPAPPPPPPAPPLLAPRNSRLPFFGRSRPQKPGLSYRTETPFCLAATGPLQTPKSCPLPFLPPYYHLPPRDLKSWSPCPTQPGQPSLLPALPTSPSPPSVFPHSLPWAAWSRSRALGPL